jgi:low temperature requirement protein LtrA
MRVPRLPIARIRALHPRSAHEDRRVATPLELFFDLVFVVCVSSAAGGLAALEQERSLGAAFGAYALLFFAIWWAWMNFTWFASSFDNDDWLYRILTFVQMAGALVMAAGIGPAMQQGDFALAAFGYLIIRAALVTQWFRAAAAGQRFRSTALRYATAITALEALWLCWVVLAPSRFQTASFLALAALELLVPAWSNRPVAPPWHPRHVAERYGLFTLIVLGEGVAASTHTAVSAFDHGEQTGRLLVFAFSALAIIACLWWLYFARPDYERLRRMRGATLVGYGHYFVFAAAGAIPAGVEIIVASTEAAPASGAGHAAALTIPVLAFIIAVWLLFLRRALPQWRSVGVLIGTALIGCTTFAGWWALPLTAAALIGIVAVIEVRPSSQRPTGSGQGHN